MNRMWLPGWLAVFCSIGFMVHAGPEVMRGRFASGNRDFAFKVFVEISREQPDVNIFISPYGVSSILQMAGNGAGGATQEEIWRGLGWPDIQPADLNEAHRDVERMIFARDTDGVLTCANAIWYRQGLGIKPEFIACNQRYFQAEVAGLDFNSPSTPGVMNGWVNQKTRGKIPKIVDGPIGTNEQVYLANAVYLKARWSTPFEVKKTRERLFQFPDERMANVRMMVRGDDFSYLQGEGFQAVCLPYRGSGLSMYVLLPDAGVGLKRLVAALNGESWQKGTVPAFEKRAGRLELPRFKVEYKVDFRKPLAALGIKAAFDAGEADFRALAGDQTFISQVRQQAFVEVDEEGTEAAAATGSIIQSSGIRDHPPKPFEMIVDRPFLCIIEHGESNTILFMGAIYYPTVVR